MTNNPAHFWHIIQTTTMLKTINYCVLLAIVLVSCGNPPDKAPKTPPPEPAPVESHEASSHDSKPPPRNYYFPTPGEIFTALSKIDDIAWLKNATTPETLNFESDHENSFWLGVCVADAFVSLKAGNRDVFSEMNQHVFSMSESLGIEDELTTARQQLSDHNQGADLDVLASDLDQLYMDFVRSLDDYQNGETIYTFSNIGGWAEGVRIIGSDLQTNFNQESAQLIFDTGLISELVKHAHLFDPEEETQKVEDIKNDLKKAKEIISKNKDAINIVAVNDLVEIANHILDTFK